MIAANAIRDAIATNSTSDHKQAGDRRGFPATDFLDVRFDVAAPEVAIAAIRQRHPAKPFAYVITPNVDHIVRLKRDRTDLRHAYQHAWITLCDSRILGWMARIAGLTLPVFPGSDLTRTMFRTVIAREDRIAIIGGDPTSAALLAARYRLADVRHFNPPMGFIDDPAEIGKAVRFITEARARYCFIAVGSPQQELLALHVACASNATGIGLCIGASLDFLTGAQIRAPRLMQRMSLEWLFRLGSNPGRLWRRYLVDGPAILFVFQRWRRDQRGK